MKLEMYSIAFLLVCCVGRIMAGRFEVVCGSPPDNPAIIHYYGDVAVVFAYRRDEIINCMFEPLSHGVFSREITFNLTNPCGFVKTSDVRDIYAIHLETRTLHELIQSDDDEEMTAVCSFMAYADAEIVIEIV